MPRGKGIVLELIEVDEKVCGGQSFCVFIDPAIFCSRENSLKTELCFRGMSSWCQAIESQFVKYLFSDLQYGTQVKISPSSIARKSLGEIGSIIMGILWGDLVVQAFHFFVFRNQTSTRDLQLLQFPIRALLSCPSGERPRGQKLNAEVKPCGNIISTTHPS